MFEWTNIDFILDEIDFFFKRIEGLKKKQFLFKKLKILWKPMSKKSMIIIMLLNDYHQILKSEFMQFLTRTMKS